MDNAEIYDVLINSELFSGIEKAFIEKIVALCTIESYEAGEKIFSQGDYGKDIYIIAEGYIILERSIDLGTRKGRIITAILGKGRVFGCWSTLLDEPHYLMSSAGCQKASNLIKIEGPALRKIMLSNSKLGFYIMERICTILRERIRSVYGAMEKL